MGTGFDVLKNEFDFWLSYRKFSTNRYLPAPVYLKDLYYKRPFWYGFDIQLTAQQTLEVRQTARYNFWLLSIQGMTPQAGTNNFQLQVFHVRASPESDQTPWQRLKSLLGGKFSRTAVDEANSVGSAQLKAWLRYPYRFPQGDTILIQIKNLTAGNLLARICLEGVDDGAIIDGPR